MAKQDIRCISEQDLQDFLALYKQPSFRAKQISEWLWTKHVHSFSDMTNIPLSLRTTLDENFTIAQPEILTKQVSKDGTRKYLLGFSDGCAVETVGIPSHDKSRLTVCFSTQSGCAMGCSFCATGQAGFSRNLTTLEMYDQICVVADDFSTRVSNVVAMGQGEPFLNYNSTINALRYMNDMSKLCIGARHITVSTCGIIPGIRRLAQEPEQFTLAISLHSAIQKTRDNIMPGLKSYPLPELKRALLDYVNVTGRRPSLEYTIIHGVNDDREHLDALVGFCSGLLCHVNLIPLNPSPTAAQELRLQPSENMDVFYTHLMKHDIETSIRSSRGADIDGACGQLYRREVDQTS